jgi:hypothetical protein
VILTPAQGTHDFPYLFEGKAPPSNPATEIVALPKGEPQDVAYEQVGSQDYRYAFSIAIDPLIQTYTVQGYKSGLS